MVAGGLLSEAAALLGAGLAPNGGCVGRAIGYRQAMAFLQRSRAELEAAGQQKGQRQQHGSPEAGVSAAVGSSVEQQQQVQKAGNEWGRQSKRHKGACGASSGPKVVPSSLSEAGIAALAKEVAAASRQLCTRQMTWFRDDELFR